MTTTDYVQLPATGAGTANPKIAAEPIGGVRFQHVKMVGGGAGVAHEFKQDAYSHALTTVTFAHHEIHEGDHFRLQPYATASGLILAFYVPDQTKRPNLVVTVISESSGYLQILEGPTWTTSTGTAKTPINSERASTNTSVLQGDASGSFVANSVVQDPTGLTGGSVIYDLRVWTDRKSGGGSAETREEHMLDVDEKYAIQWVSTDGAKGIQLDIGWYEHSNSTP